MPRIKGTNYPKDVFLVRDKNDVFHWYTKDPMKAENREEHEISVENEIMNLVGKGTVENPVVVHISCARINRSEAFNMAQPSEVRRGNGNRHFEDLTGAVIDILEVRNSNPDFPLSGVVFNKKGDIVDNRRYSIQGLCEDGDEDHTIVIVNGPALFESDVREEGAEEGAEEGDGIAPIEAPGDDE